MQKTQQPSPRSAHPAQLNRVNAHPTCVVTEINRTMPQISIFSNSSEPAAISTSASSNAATSLPSQRQIVPSFPSTNGAGAGTRPLITSTALLALPSNMEGGVPVPLTSEVVVIKTPSLSSGAHAKNLTPQWVLQKQPMPQLVPILPQEVIQQIVVGKPPPPLKSNSNTLLKAQLNSGSQPVPPAHKLVPIKQYPGTGQLQQQKTPQTQKQNSSPQQQIFRQHHIKQQDPVLQQTQVKQLQPSVQHIIQKPQQPLKPILPKPLPSPRRQSILAPPPNQVQQPQQQAPQKPQTILQRAPQQQSQDQPAQSQDQPAKSQNQPSKEQLIEQHVLEKRLQLKQLQLKQQQQRNQFTEQLQQEQKQQLLKERHQQNRQLLQQQLQQAMKQAQQQAKKQSKSTVAPPASQQKQKQQDQPPTKVIEDLVEQVKQLPVQKLQQPPQTIKEAPPLQMLSKQQQLPTQEEQQKVIQPTQEMQPSTDAVCATANPLVKQILLSSSSEGHTEVADTEIQVLNKFVNITKTKRGASDESLLKTNVNRLSPAATQAIEHVNPINDKGAAKHTDAAESSQPDTVPNPKPDEGSCDSLLKLNLPKHVYGKGRLKRAYSLTPGWGASRSGAADRRHSTTALEHKRMALSKETSEENVVASIVLDSSDETGDFLKCDEKFPDSLNEKKPESPKSSSEKPDTIIEDVIHIAEDEIEDAVAALSETVASDEQPQHHPTVETMDKGEYATDGPSPNKVSRVTYQDDDVQLLHNDSAEAAKDPIEESDDLQIIEQAKDDCEVYEILSDPNDSGTQLGAEASPLVGTGHSAPKSRRPTKYLSKKACLQAAEVLASYNMLTWKDRVGIANGTSMRFELNEYNLLQIHEPCAERQHVHTAYEKPIHERQPMAIPTPDNQLMYRCRRCKCYGHAEDFLAPEFCSLQCIKRDNRKRRSHLAKNRPRSDGPGLAVSSNTTEKSGCLKTFSWSTHLKQHFLSCAAPVHLFVNPFPTAPNRFTVGMRLEAIDPANASLFCVCNVADIQGFRLRLNFDGYDPMYDFWVNADSPDIFPAGFCMKTNRVLQPPKGMENGFFNWQAYCARKRASAAPRALFTWTNTKFNNPFKVGMHLEAEDLHDTGKLCVASVGDVLGDRIRIHFDGWDSCYDYWAHINSPYLHPCGYHEGRQQLIAPPEYDQSSFDWPSYLSRHHSWVPAGKHLFAPRDAFDFRSHMKLEIVDDRNPMLIRPATVLSRSKYRLKLHLDGWPDEYVVFADDDSPDLHPVGWCDATGHILEPPPGYKMFYGAGTCGFIGCRGIGNAKNRNVPMHGLRDHCPYAPHNWQTKLEKPKRLGVVKAERKQMLKASINKIQPPQRTAIPMPSMHSTAARRLTASRMSADYNAEFEKMVISSAPKIKPIKIEIEAEKEKERRSLLVASTNINARNVKTEPLELHLNIAKRFLCDYGPRLKQNYKIWHSNFTFDADRIQFSPLKWTVAETAAFVLEALRMPALAKLLQNEDVDGEALLALKQVDLTGRFGVKLGHSIKLSSLVVQLRMLAVTKFGEILTIE